MKEVTSCSVTLMTPWQSIRFPLHNNKVHWQCHCALVISITMKAPQSPTSKLKNKHQLNNLSLQWSSDVPFIVLFLLVANSHGMRQKDHEWLTVFWHWQCSAHCLLYVVDCHSTLYVIDLIVCCRSLEAPTCTTGFSTQVSCQPRVWEQLEQHQHKHRRKCIRSRVMGKVRLDGSQDNKSCWEVENWVIYTAFFDSGLYMTCGASDLPIAK